MEGQFNDNGYLRSPKTKAEVAQVSQQNQDIKTNNIVRAKLKQLLDSDVQICDFSVLQQPVKGQFRTEIRITYYIPL